MNWALSTTKKPAVLVFQVNRNDLNSAKRLDLNNDEDRWREIVTSFRLGRRTAKTRKSVSAYWRTTSDNELRRSISWAALETEVFILPDVLEFRPLCWDVEEETSFNLFLRGFLNLAMTRLTIFILVYFNLQEFLSLPWLYSLKFIRWGSDNQF